MFCRLACLRPRRRSEFSCCFLDRPVGLCGLVPGFQPHCAARNDRRALAAEVRGASHMVVMPVRGNQMRDLQTAQVPLVHVPANHLYGAFVQATVDQDQALVMPDAIDIAEAEK
jgi:hypothetical protein